MNKVFQIGDFRFRLITPEEINPPANFMLFETCEDTVSYTFTVELGEEFPDLPGEKSACREDLIVYKNGELENRLIGVKGVPGHYACYQELSDSEAKIMLAPSKIGSLHIDPVFCSLLALERHLLRREAFVLHCAYIEHQGEAILFSAPSETGKTTQGNLWERYKGAKTINGDRALLQKVDGRWIARGWPVCGSSEVCNNIEIPIRAIVMLSQGKEDVVTKLTPMKAFAQVYSQITINRWNLKSNKDAMDRIERLVTDIPVWHLSCTISENAVNTLAEVLYPIGE